VATSQVLEQTSIKAPYSICSEICRMLECSSRFEACSL